MKIDVPYRICLTGFLFLLTLQVLCGSVFAQPSHGELDSLVRKGEKALSAGDVAGAQASFEAALQIDKRSVAALLGAGRVSIEFGEFGSGIDFFDDLLTVDPMNVPAHFYRGICYRENGKSKAWIMRNSRWKDAANDFQWVVAHDSLFEDVFAQEALLLNCQERYVDAIAWGDRQIRARPELVNARLMLFKLYRSFITNEPTAALTWLKPRETVISRFFVGEIYRRDEKLEDAERIFRSLLALPDFTLAQPVDLALARIAAKRSDAENAEQFFWQAVNDISTPFGADLVFEDIKYVVSDRELTLFASLDSPQKKAEFFRSFWALRNPLPGSNANPRIAEHYRRLVYAEENFEYTGFRTQFTNPDKMRYLAFPQSYMLNQEYNDKGLVYIRHGEPDNKQRISDENGDQNESWMYYQTAEAPRRVFHFAKMNAVGNNWRLTPIPTNPLMFNELLSWDPRYADLLRSNSTSQVEMTDRLIGESQRAVSAALVTDEHTWAKEITPLVIPFSVDRFRSTDRKSLVDISFGIPLAPFVKELKEDTQTFHVEVGLSLQALSHMTTTRKLDTLSFSVSRQSSGALANMYRFSVPPDSYSIAMHVRPIEIQALGNWKCSLAIPLYSSTGGLLLSDLELLTPSPSRSTLDIDGLKVAPIPFNRRPRTNPLYVYFQIYNLVKDADGRTERTVRYALVPEGSADQFDKQPDPEQLPDDAVVLSRQDKQGNEDTAAEFGVLDVTNVGAGSYILVAIVSDRKRVQSVRCSRIIELFEP